MDKLKVRKNTKLEIKKYMTTCDSRPEGLHSALGFNMSLMIVGGPGSGKTNMIQNLINRKQFYYRRFEKVYIFSPSLKTIKKKIKLPAENMMSKFDLARLEEIIAEEKESDNNILVILDDCVNDLIRNMTPVLTMLYNRRHIGKGLSCIITTQKYNKLPAEYRAVMSHIAFFNGSAKKELSYLYDEYVNMEKKLFDQVVRTVFDGPHQFLYMDINKPEFDSKYYKNFSKIIFKDDGEELVLKI
jgi:hypothetical protein